MFFQEVDQELLGTLRVGQGSSIPRSCIPARAATSVDLLIVTQHLEIALPTDVFLHFFDERMIEFVDSPAGEADQVVMVGVAQDMFIHTPGFHQFHFSHQPTGGQEVQGAIDGGAGYARLPFLQPQIQIFRIEMVMMTIDFFQDFPPRTGDFLAGAAQEFDKL